MVPNKIEPFPAHSWQVVDRDKGKGEDAGGGDPRPVPLVLDQSRTYATIIIRITAAAKLYSIDLHLQDGTWGTDTMTFQDDELSYALGKQGGTRQQSQRRGIDRPAS